MTYRITWTETSEKSILLPHRPKGYELDMALVANSDTPWACVLTREDVEVERATGRDARTWDRLNHQATAPADAPPPEAGAADPGNKLGALHGLHERHRAGAALLLQIHKDAEQALEDAERIGQWFETLRDKARDADYHRLAVQDLTRWATFYGAKPAELADATELNPDEFYTKYPLPAAATA